MLNKAKRLNRGRLGILRIAAIITGFLVVMHFAHRECARNTDRPARPKSLAAAPASLPTAKQTEASDKGDEIFHATAYCLTGITKAGVPTAPGYVSADPKVIPLGSMIYIETPLMSGVYQVMDTGAAIKGKIIDIFIPSYEACLEFGRRVVKVKVLRYGFKGDHPSKQHKQPDEKTDSDL